MSYNLSWHISEHVLYLSIEGKPNLQELKAINQDVTNKVRHYKKLNIIFDTTKIEAGYYTARQLRETQTYMNSFSLDTVYFVDTNKLHRLITLMAFSTVRVKFFQCQTLEHAENMLKQRGFTTEP